MTQSFDPGRVSVRLSLADGRIAAVVVSCVRPDVARLLVGQAAEKAVALVPLVYSLCGKAQAVAARAALTAANGAAVAAHVDAGVLAEAAREHAWKLLVDWPRQFGLAADEPAFVRLVRAPAAERAAVAAALRENATLSAMRETLRRDGGAVDRLLGERLAARVAELLDYLEGRPQALGTVSAQPLAARAGRAGVMTARGELVHELALDGERVARYSIVAPTDIHFAADSPLAGWLAGLPADQAERAAGRAIMALDPCVPWRCEREGS